MLLPYDVSGIAPSNRKTVTENLTVGGSRAIYPEYGAYFSDYSKVIVQHVSSGNILTSTQWHPGEHEPELTIDTTQEVSIGLIITDMTLTGDFTVTANYVGGLRGRGDQAIKVLTEKVAAAASGGASLADINAPLFYNPGVHTHTVDQLNEIWRFTNAFNDAIQLLEMNKSMGSTYLNMKGKIERIQKQMLVLAQNYSRINGLAATGVASQVEVTSISDSLAQVMVTQAEESLALDNLEIRVTNIETAINDMVMFLNNEIGGLAISPLP